MEQLTLGEVKINQISKGYKFFLNKLQENDYADIDSTDKVQSITFLLNAKTNALCYSPSNGVTINVNFDVIVIVRDGSGRKMERNIRVGNFKKIYNEVADSCAFYKEENVVKLNEIGRALIVGGVRVA
jgi:hypothetical protein